jgi:hypothetical protein
MVVVRVLSILCGHHVLVLRMSILVRAGLVVGTLVLLHLVRLLMSVVVGHDRILLAMIGVNWLLLLSSLITISMSTSRHLMAVLIRHRRVVTTGLVDLFILQHSGLPSHR